MKKLSKLLILFIVVKGSYSFAQPVMGMTTFFTNTTTVIHVNTSCVSTKTAVLSGWLLSVSSTSNCGMNWTNSTGGDGRFQYLMGFGTMTQATFGSDDGSEFALQNLTWGVGTSSLTSKPMIFSGYKNGVPVPTATMNATTPSGTGILNTLVINFTSIAGFNNVDEVRLSPAPGFTCNTTLFFEDITIGAATASCTTPTLDVLGQTNVLCNGGSIGSATVSASGGAPFTYTWSPSGGNSPTATGLSAGTYTCITTNSCGSTATKTVTITEPVSPLVTFTAVTNALCNGSQGSATVSASGGTAPYTYTWSSGPTFSVEPTLLAGTYTVKVTDANNCTSTKSVTITQPTAINATTVLTNVSCNGGSNGAINLTPSGGTPVYTFSWNGGATTEDRTGLVAGSYSCTITDANSCTKSVTSIIVTQPTAINATTVLTNVSCNGGSNGAINLTPSGGTPVYTFSWNGGATTEDRTGLFAGSYSCTITDANSCTKSVTSIIITQPTALNITPASQTNISCNGGSNGAASVSVSGGASGYTYNWTPGNPTGDGTTSVTGLTAGTWSCTVTDANSCTGTQTFNITQPTAINVSPVSQTNISCNGGSNGAATINTPTGGAGGYTYNWTPGNPTGDGTTSVTGLTAGTWSCTVTDANSCTGTQTFNITQPTAINVSPVSQTNVSCNGGSNGAASVSVSGGAGGYTYNWTPGNPTGDGTTSITGLSAGTWSCTITDANSCTSTQTFNITQPTALSITPASQTNISCNGGSNGAASINTPTGGAGGYTYNWTPGNPTGDGTTSVSGLSAGTWTCTITDANSCTGTQTFNITQPSALSITPASQTNVSCNGSSNGAASINTPTGGAGGYTYNWTPGNPTGDGTTSVTGLSAGTWSCTITDANACTGTQTFNITQPGAISITPASQTNVSCNGSSNGAATINTPTGGAGGYTYNWTPGTPTGDGTTSVTGLSAGTWTCTVTDANACSKSQTFTITQPTAISSTTVVTNVSCNGGSNGAINLTPNGGTPGYTFNWGAGVITEDRTGLIAGSYTYTITDANGCTNISSVSVTEPSAIATTTSITNILCNGGSTGSATLTSSGGTSPYTYLWSTGATTSVITSQPVGVKTVTLTDANGCTSVNSVILTQPTALSTSTTVTNVLCNGGTNGIAGISATGGTGGYSYSWTPSGGTGASATGLSAGSYTCTITDANSCAKTDVVNVTQPSAITTSTAVTNILCNGGSTGSATLTASGGSGPYSYLWSTGATTTVITGQTAGVKTVTVTDANSCTKTVTINITQPSALALTINTTTTAICEGATSTFTANVTGGTTSYSYIWSTGATSNSISVSPISTTSYTAFITDANGCTINSSITLTVNAIPTLTVNSGAICIGNSYTISPSGASSYTYSGGSSVVSPTINTVYNIIGASAFGCTNTAISSITVNAIPTLSVNSGAICSGNSFTISPSGASTYTYSSGSSIVSPTTTTNYTVTGSSSFGCTNTAVSSITVNALPTLTVNSGTICSGNTFTINPSGALSYVISGGSTVVSPIATSNYTVIGSDAFGCSNSAISTVSVNANPIFNILGNTNVCQGNSTILTATGTYTYNWTGGITNGVSFTPTTTTVYSVTAINAGGCTSMLSIMVNVNPIPSVSLTAATYTSCVQDNNILLTGSPSGGVYSGINVIGNEFVPYSTGTYTINYVYTDVNMCTNSTSTSIVVNACVGIEELSENINLQVYPNPTTGIINIEYSGVNTESNKVKIQITNALGQIIFTKQMHEKSDVIDIQQFEEGIYFISIIKNNKVVKTNKIIRN